MKRAIVALILTLALHGAANALKLLDPSEVIKQRKLALSDGSSVYIFDKDGSFRSGPLGMSGRTIKGTWQMTKSGLQVNGMWSGVNMLSNSEERTMRIHIGALTDELQETKTSFYGTLQISKAYFFIDELRKVKVDQETSKKQRWKFW